MGNRNSGGVGSSTTASGSSTKVGTKLNDSVYLLHEPRQPQVEVVFIHGLQAGDFEDAYWKTWLARDGLHCWPGTWLKQTIPTARILSLSYDSRAMKSREMGEDIDLYSIGEALLQQMALARIGQNNCPVVFVCHSLGGLVAKQIVVHAWRKYGSNQSVDASKDLLQNLIGIFFYATPHSGSELADFADKLLDRMPFVEKSLVVGYLKVLCKETALLNNDFEQVHSQEFKSDWKFQVIGETHKTKLGPNIYKMVVPEASARLVGVPYMSLNADHINVCKPKATNDTSFVMLEAFIRDAVGTHLEHGEILDLV